MEKRDDDFKLFAKNIKKKKRHRRRNQPIESEEDSPEDKQSNDTMNSFKEEEIIPWLEEVFPKV
jgi:hypothetical protein